MQPTGSEAWWGGQVVAWKALGKRDALESHPFEKKVLVGDGGRRCTLTGPIYGSGNGRVIGYALLLLPRPSTQVASHGTCTISTAFVFVMAMCFRGGTKQRRNRER